MAGASGRRRSSTRETAMRGSKHAEVCPLVTETLPTVASNEKQPPTTDTNRTPADYLNMAEICPWDFDEKLSGKNA